MERVYESGAAAAAPTPPAVPSIGYPSRGNPSTGTMPTIPGPYMMHQLVEEIMAVTAAAGIAPDKLNLTQLLTALRSAGVFQNAAQFDDTTKVATTAWVNDRGLGYSSLNGRPLAASCAILPAWMGSWGEVQQPGYTYTMPKANTVLVGVAFTFKFTFGGTIAVVAGDVLISDTPAFQAGEVVTVVSNGVGNSWYVVAVGHSIAIGDARYVKQGSGIGQTPNQIKIGWSAAGRLKATVDNTDLGNLLTDGVLPSLFPSIAGGFKLPNGAMVQAFLTAPLVNGSSYVPFPTAFPSACWSACITATSAQPSATTTSVATGVSNAGLTIVNNASTSPVAFFVIAVGY